MTRFKMATVTVPPAHANLVVLADAKGAPIQAVFTPFAKGGWEDGVLFSARVDWGGADNPLLAALPERAVLPVRPGDDLRGLVDLLCAESMAPRCGGASVLKRLAEVLMVRLLRYQIECGGAGDGLLVGLADARVSRAIVAIHDFPGRNWTGQDLACEAGLSQSRFSELFSEQVGISPMAYLRQWRMTVAQQDLRQGDRVEQVARRYGYGSPEAFSRAFRQRFGVPPLEVRRGT